MKINFHILIIVLICMAMPVYSQSTGNPGGRISLGVIGGLHLANMHFPNNDESGAQEITAQTRLGAGAIVDIKLTENLFARIEPMVLQKGCTVVEGPDPNEQPGGKIKSSYLEIPLLLRYSFGERIKPYFIAGPTIGFNLSIKTEFEIEGFEFEGDLKEVTRSMDLGLTFGGGIELPVSFGTLFLEGRYVLGLLNQSEPGTATIEAEGFEIELETDGESDKYFHRGLIVMAGVTFPLN